MSNKPTNPKDALGSLKSAAHHFPAHVKHKAGLAMLEGAIKYGSMNYRVAGVRSSIYYDALSRHMDAWWEGQEIDPDSNLPHLWKAMACITILIDAVENDKLNDDRPPKLANQDWVRELNEMAATLIKRLPPALPPYTEATYRQTELFEQVNPPPINAYEVYQRELEKAQKKVLKEKNKEIDAMVMEALSPAH